MLIDSAGQIGNGIQLRDMKNGALTTLDTAKSTYQGLNWHESADAFSTLRGVEEKGVEGKVFSIVAFTDVGSGAKKSVFEPKSDATFPKNMGISTNRNAAWSEDQTLLTFGIAEQKRTEEPKKEEPKKSEAKKDAPEAGDFQRGPRPTTAPPQAAGKPDLVVWHWKDDRLQSQQQTSAAADKLISFACAYRVKDKKFLRLADDTVKSVGVAPKQKFAIGRDSREYDLPGSLNGQSFSDIYVTNLETGERKKALTKVRWAFGPSPDGTHMLYYDDGHFRTLELATLKTHVISDKASTSFIDTEDDHNVDRPPTRTLGWSADGKLVYLSDNWDIWQLGVHGETATNLTLDGKLKGIRYVGPVSLDVEEKGIDPTKPMYVHLMEERTKKSGYGRIDPAKPGVNVLVWEDASIGGLAKAKKADVFMYVRQTAIDSPDFYLADATLNGGKKVTNANPQQKDYAWSAGARLVDYTSLNGDKLQAALYLPADYKPAIPDGRTSTSTCRTGCTSTPRPGGALTSRSTRATVRGPDAGHQLQLNDPGCRP